MYDEIDRENRNSRVRSNPKSEESQKEDSGLSGILIIQTIIVAVLLIAAYIIKLLGGEIYVNTQKSVSQFLFTNSFADVNIIKESTEKVRSVFKEFYTKYFENGEDLVPASNSSNPSDSSSNTSSGIGSSSSSSSGSSSSNSTLSSSSKTSSTPASSNTSSSTSSLTSSNNSSSKSAQSSSKATTPSSSKTNVSSSNSKTAATSTLSGMGGMNEVLENSDREKMMPPKNASFSPILLTAKLTIPVEGEITSDFGYRMHPITNKLDFHTGVDIAAPEGTKISCALSGTVYETGYSDIFGNYIILSHGGNLKTFYGHLSEIDVEQGFRMRKGETIGLVGNTGISTGAHLHFEIRVNDISYDPIAALKGDTANGFYNTWCKS